jgi:threonine dehydratase
MVKKMDEKAIELKLYSICTDVESAYERIKTYIYKTPLTISRELSYDTGAKVYLKLGK